MQEWIRNNNVGSLHLLNVSIAESEDSGTSTEIPLTMSVTGAFIVDSNTIPVLMYQLYIELLGYRTPGYRGISTNAK